MYIKVLKISICIFLIMGLSIPIFADTNVSDGSKFVTKAEFDSVLADFNSRLTTFEAGINSKIDSQVTSYLDQNGIWKSKEQDINGQTGKSKGEYSVGLYDVLGVTGTTLTCYYQATNNNFTTYTSTSQSDCSNWTSGYKQNTYTFSPALVNKVNKSGLMNVVGTFGDATVRTVSLLRTNNVYTQDACYSVKVTWKLMKKSGSSYTCEWSDQWTWDANQVTSLWSARNKVYALIPKMAICAYFFVKESDQIYCEVDGRIYATNATVQMSPVVINYEIKEAKVY